MQAILLGPGDTVRRRAGPGPSSTAPATFSDCCPEQL